VLVLWAGVGPARTHSRAVVARRLGLSVAQVRRIESRGVRTLRRLDRATDCAPGAGPAPVSEGIAALTGVASPLTAAAVQPGGGGPVFASARTGTGAAGGDAPASGGNQTSGGGQTGGGGHGGGDTGSDATGGSGGDRGGVLGETAEQPATLLPPSESTGPGWMPWMLLLSLLVLLGFGLRALRATRG
jgi:hypothetical protein